MKNGQESGSNEGAAQPSHEIDAMAVERAWQTLRARQNLGLGIIGGLVAAALGAVLWAGFSQDGRRIATASRDGEVWLWDSNGSFLATLKGHTGPVVSAAFSPDGTQLVSASQDESAIVWKVLSDIDAMVAQAEERVHRTLTMAECRTYLHLERCP